MRMPLDWHRDFFGGLAAEFWHAFPTPAQTAAEVDFALRLLAPPPAAALLDVPCGDGRHACELAARGFAVTAVDASATLLAHARARAAQIAAPPAFHHADMRALPPAPPCDGAVCLGNSFGYLGDAGDAAFLGAVRRSLRQGARFLLDAAAVETLLPAFQPQRWFAVGDLLMLSSVHWDPVAGELRSDYTFVRGAERERKSAWLRLRSVRATVDLLLGAGFGGVQVLGPAGEPFRQGDPRAWFLATA